MLKLAVFTLMAALLMVSSSSALLPTFTKEELIQKSEAVLMGVITKINCAWADDHSQIYTYVTLDVQDQFKGQPVGEEFVVQIPGGTVGEMTQWVSDTPRLSVGMRVVLHSFMQDNGYNWIYGWEKGVLQVENNAIPAYGMSVDQFRALALGLK
jgi:hypothetical protein